MGRDNPIGNGVGPVSGGSEMVTAKELRDASLREPMWGHVLRLADDTISCEQCEMELTVPEMFTQTSGFREAVYKMYLFGEFKYSDCEREWYEHDRRRQDEAWGSIQYDPDRVNWL